METTLRYQPQFWANVKTVMEEPFAVWTLMDTREGFPVMWGSEAFMKSTANMLNKLETEGPKAVEL